MNLMVRMAITDDLQDAIQPAGVTGWDVGIAIVVMIAAIPISRAADHLARKAAQPVPGISADASRMVGRAGRYLVLLIAGSLALNLIGVDVGWAVAVAAICLVILVLIMRPMVENAAAGLLLQSRPSFAVGDEVEIEGYTGKVIEISARTTVLKTGDGRRVHIPNTDVLGGTIVVLSAFDSRRVNVDIGVDPNDDLEKVTKVLIDAVSAVDNVLPDPAPAVIARSFGDGFINLSIRFWFGPDTHSDVRVTDAALRAIQRAVNEAGIDMPPPQLAVQTQVRSPASEESSSKDAT